jgi:hypothetical protein
MTRHLRAIRGDPVLRQSLIDNGLAAIRERHSCAHRARELLDIVARLAAPTLVKATA